jgi:hypothetical protein
LSSFLGVEEFIEMVGSSSQEEAVALAAGRVGAVAALAAIAIGLAVLPAVLAVALMVAGPLATGAEPDAGPLGHVLQSLNVLRLGAGAALLLTLPLLRSDR